MRIAKPMLIVSTPVGVIGGLYEGYQLAGGLVFLMLAMLLPVTAAIGGVVLTIRRERAQAARGTPGPSADGAAPAASAENQQ